MFGLIAADEAPTVCHPCPSAKTIPTIFPFINRKNHFYFTLIFPYLLFHTCSYFIRIKCILTIFTPQNNIKNKIFYSQKQTHKLYIVFFTITICKKRQKHSINSPRNSPRKAIMVIIGNYSRKMRFSDAKSPKRATLHSFLLPLFLKIKFPLSPLFRSEILPKSPLFSRKFSDFVSISAVFCCFLLFFAVFYCFLLFFCFFVSFLPILFHFLRFVCYYPWYLYNPCSPFKYLILHLCTNFSCIAALCTLYYHVFILAELQSSCLFVQRFFSIWC